MIVYLLKKLHVQEKSGSGHMARTVSFLVFCGDFLENGSNNFSKFLICCSSNDCLSSEKTRMSRKNLVPDIWPGQCLFLVFFVDFLENDSNNFAIFLIYYSSNDCLSSEKTRMFRKNLVPDI